MRISKYLSTSGITSRRKAEKLVETGRIKVNNKVITDLSYKINPETDILMLDGNIIKHDTNKIYIKLFKPAGYITSLKDEFGRQTVFNLINLKERIFPVGRLDKDTRGLLLLTNDGDLAYKITHPKYEVTKIYKVLVKGIPTNENITMLEKGIEFEGMKTYPAKITITKTYQDSCDLLIKIHEGKKRQIRKMFEFIGNSVIDLLRLKIGPIDLGNLKEGQWEYLNRKELDSLKRYLEGNK
ncbi:MAG: pseudouridine synthase [Thermoanaerobacteraceae bacterium]|nr:pseudouridine synthase [Thermoanaerobacteraceae bacterium]